MNEQTLTREEAIDRMRDGLPCETRFGGCDDWFPTCWGHLDPTNRQVWFRRPPEPQRVAETWNGVVYLGFVGRQPVEIRAPGITLREVLPGEITLQRMTRAELNALSSKYDSWDDVFCALGVIGEGS